MTNNENRPGPREIVAKPLMQSIISQGGHRNPACRQAGVGRKTFSNQCIIQDLHRVVGMLSGSLPDLLPAACS